MNRTFREVTTGVFIGVILALCYICFAYEPDTEKADQEIASYELARVETIPFEEQIKEDEEKIYQEWKSTTYVGEAVEVKSAPYSNIPLDDDLQVFLEERCKAYDIDFFLAVALMESESSFDVEAEGDNGNSVGLMQVNSVWWDSMYERGLDVFNYRDNIDAGLIILREYLDKYQDEATAIQMYKCGETRGREFLAADIVLSQCTDVLERAEEIEEETIATE